jgi:hypothetical protein
MQPHEADPPGSVPSPPPAPAAAPAHRPARAQAAAGMWLTALGAALLAGAVSGLIGERTHKHFQPPAEVAEALNPGSLNTVLLNLETSKAHGRNGAVVYGTLGGLLGLGLGLAGGLARRSITGAIAGGIVGLILGAVAGALPSFAVMPWIWYNRHDNADASSLLVPILVHGGLWCALGAAAGLAYGLGRTGLNPAGLLKSAIGGLVGAALGVVVYDAIGFGLFPLSRTDESFAASITTRMLAHLCVAVFVALGTVLMGTSQYHPTPPTAPSNPRPA